ncbi:MAG: TAXI family TRAP transporter solute-binding subunit [Rhodospirillaceae bacterium]|nr:TAXI family TRAP transporter solute-binding subunit [Rhodospirillaceae bacterium]
MRYGTPMLVMAMGFGFAISTPSASYAADQYSLAVGSLGGTMGRLGAGISDVFNKNQSAAKFAVSPGGGRANPARLGTGGADLAFSFSNFTATAIAGTTPFKKPYKNLRVIAKFWDSCYHQYVAKELYNSGIKSWEDIVSSKKALKIALVKKGTSSEYTGYLISKFLGSSYEKMAKRGDKQTFTGAGAMSRAIRSKQIDIYFHNSGDPQGAGLQAALGRDLKFMGMSDNVKKMLATHGYTPCVIPGGIYKGNDKDTHSMGLSGVLLTTDKMSADTVYSLLKTIKNNKKALSAVHKIFKKWDPKRGAGVKGLPFHKGAVKFYKEMGVM